MSKAAEEAEVMAEELYQQAYGDAEGDTDESQNLETEEQVTTVTEAEGTQNLRDDGLQHKYDTLQGMYNADIQKLQQQVSFLQGMLADQAPAAKATEQSHGPEQDKSIEYLNEEYPYVVEAVYAIFKQEMAKERQSILNEVGAAISQIMGRVNDLGSVTGQTQSSLFWSRLSELVDDWEVWNTNKEFLAWLDEEEPLTGYKRFDLLKQAKANYNAEKVATFFIEFKRQKGITQTAGRQASASERMLAPGRSSGSVSQTTRTGGDRSLTREDIAQFYRDVQRGLYNGKDKERVEMENRIARMAADMSKRK